MKIIKNFIVFIFLVGSLIYLGRFFYFYSLGPCGKPLEYSIGRFDTEFGVSEENFKSYVLEAEKPWEKALGKDIFVYNLSAKFKINLIYDERQQNTETKQKIEFGLTASENIFKKLDAEFNSLKIVYDARVLTHQEAIKDFEVRQKDYESKVNFWNSKNGAPKSEFESLQNEQTALNQEAIRLNTEGSVINLLTKDLNALLAKRNLAGSEYNQIAKNYNKKYGHGLEFNQAEYATNEINVYQFGGRYDLILALTHEFGHSLSMDHVENSKSIMYYVTGDNIESSPTPTEEDLVELRRVCPDVSSRGADLMRRLKIL